MPVEWVTIKNPTRDDAIQAYAGVKLSWLVRFVMRCSDDTMRFYPLPTGAAVQMNLSTGWLSMSAQPH